MSIIPDYAGRPSKRREKAKEKAEKAEEAEREEPTKKKRQPTRVLGVPILIVVVALFHVISAISAVLFLAVLLGILDALLILVYIWVAYNIFTMRSTAWILSLMLNGGMALFNLFYTVVAGLALNLITIILLILPSVRKEFGR